MRFGITQPFTALAALATVVFSPTAASGGESAPPVRTVATPDGGKPVVARVDAGGAIHLLYDSADGPKYARSTDDGRTFGTPIVVVDGGEPRPAGLQFAAWDMAVGRAGHVHVALGTNAWRLKRPKDEWGFFHAALEPGGTAFGPARNINRRPSEGFSLAADAAGNVTACWLAGKLYANVSADAGTTFGPAVEIDPAYDPCDCCTTSAAYGGDGRLAVLYREQANDERDMCLVLWDQRQGRASRTRVGSTPWKVNGCPMTYYAVAPAGGGYVAAWPTKGQVYYARLDGEGRAASRPEVETAGANGMRTGVLALPGPDGTTLVAWKKDGRLGWQAYDARGRAVGEPGSAESPGGGAAGVVDKAGRFLLFR